MSTLLAVSTSVFVCCFLTKYLATVLSSHKVPGNSAVFSQSTWQQSCLLTKYLATELSSHKIPGNSAVFSHNTWQQCCLLTKYLATVTMTKPATSSRKNYDKEYLVGSFHISVCVLFSNKILGNSAVFSQNTGQQRCLLTKYWATVTMTKPATSSRKNYDKEYLVGSFHDGVCVLSSHNIPNNNNNDKTCHKLT